MIKRTITLIEADNGHWYEVGDPELNESIFLPSSTNILNAYPNDELNHWREASSPEEIKKAQEEGKRQGTKMHKCIELQLMGERVLTSGISDEQIKKLGLVDKKLIQYLKEDLTTREEQALIGFENFWETFKPITVGSEIMVFSIKHEFAGTLDWVGYLWDKKKKKYDLWIVDWKISKSLSRSYDLQLSSYWKAFQETYQKKIGGARLGILQLGKNKCLYSFKEVKDKKQAWDIFLTTKKIWKDYNKNKCVPKIITRRESFELNKFTKKGKNIKI